MVQEGVSIGNIQPMEALPMDVEADVATDLMVVLDVARAGE